MKGFPKTENCIEKLNVVITIVNLELLLKTLLFECGLVVLSVALWKKWPHRYTNNRMMQ